MKLLLLLSFFVTTLVSYSQLSDQVLYYPLNGNAQDITANNLDGSAYSITPVVGHDGLNDGALSFNGVNSYIDIPNSSLYKKTFPITVSFWIKLDVPSSGVVFRTDIDQSQYFGYWVVIEPDQTIQLSIGNGGPANSSGRRTKVSYDGLSLGVWHSVICIYRSGIDMDIYIDCINAGGYYSGSGSTTVGYSSFPTQLFRNETSASSNPVFVEGQMDDFMIFDRELSNTEISRYCNSNLGLDQLESNQITDFDMFPNPTSSFFKIKLETNENVEVIIENLEGKIVYQSNINQNSGDLNLDLMRGVYFVKIVDKLGLFKSKRLVISE